MDTHITTAPELDTGPGLSARLPGEPDPDAFGVRPSDTPEPLVPASVPPRARRRRALLLAGVAVAMVVLAGGAFVLSPYNHLVPLPARMTVRVHQLAAEAGLDPDHPIAPSALLANVHLPAQPTAVVTPRYEPKKPDQDLKEILAMRAGSQPPSMSAPAPSTSATTYPAPAIPTGPSAPAPSVAQAEPAPGFVPHEPGSSVMPPGTGTAETRQQPPATTSARQGPIGATDITQAVVVAATTREPPVAPAPGQAATRASPQAAATTEAASVPAGPPAAPPEPGLPSPAGPVQAATQAGPVDAAERAQHLQAGPMTDAQQVQVLELVTQMATIVHELKQQDASLRADLAKTREEESTRLKDFERRIALAEARNAIGTAETNPSAAASAPPAPAVAPVVRPVSITRASAALPVDVPAAVKRYRVQAASPGMAMLTEVDRGGGDGAQLQVTVGDKVPGWGTVKSVAQRGTSWVVSTEHGVIE